MTDPLPIPEPTSAPPVNPTGWQTATVETITDETAHAKTFRLRLERATGHRAGQHYVVRLTAPDGYTASRSYSVASAPGDPSVIELTVEKLVDGEVSSFLHDVVVPGDTLEVRGPIGGWFVWDADSPALLVGGGSGVVPLMSMLRLARATDASSLVHLVVSVRTPDDLWYRDEIDGPETTVLYTRSTPSPAWPRAAGHLRADDLEPFVDDAVTAYACGGSGFVEAATAALQELALPSERIRVERFGPSG